MSFNHLGLLTKLAKRNIFRNTRRTFLTVLLIACGLAALLFADAYMKGVYQALISMSTDTYFGQAQIHLEGFREDNDTKLFIPDLELVYQELEKAEQISAYAPRTLVGGMISSAENMAAGMIFGIDPEKEAKLSKLKRAITQGDYLSGKDKEILLGSGIAEVLEVDLGDRIVLTVSKAKDGELSQALFRVSGIFEFGDRNMDTKFAFIHIKQGQSLLGIEGVHQVALRFQHIEQVDDLSLDIWDSLNQGALETLSWRELIPQLSGILEMSSLSTWIIAVILFVLVALGLVNSMFMSIYERHFEFGILCSIGTRPRILFLQIISEGFLIGLLSVSVGTMIGLSITYYFMKNGIDLGGAEFSGVSLTDPIYPIAELWSFLGLAACILIVTVLACIYPAFYAARLKPAYAMRKTL